jgi:cation transport ATPase
VRSGETLLDLARSDAVVFDKTGTLSTLTAPSVRVLRPEAVPAGSAPSLSDDAVLRRAAAVEQGTNHALATAIVGAAEAHDLSLPTVADVATHAGAGVVGRVQKNGDFCRVGVGNERLLDTMGVAAPERLKERFAAETEAGRTPLYVVNDAAVVGLLSIEERLAPHAEEAVSAVQDEAGTVSVLTGDRPTAARRLEERLGVSAEAGLAPDEKVERLDALRDEHGPVMMVGDGINDAAALATADVGVALSSGASVSMEAADVTLYNTDLRLVPWLRRLARRTDRVIRQNLWWTFGYNAIGLGLAVAGLLHPIAAVVIMTGSSLLVTGNAFRLKRTGGPVASGDE